MQCLANQNMLSRLCRAISEPIFQESESNIKSRQPTEIRSENSEFFECQFTYSRQYLRVWQPQPNRGSSLPFRVLYFAYVN